MVAVCAMVLACSGIAMGTIAIFCGFAGCPLMLPQWIGELDCVASQPLLCMVVSFTLYVLSSQYINPWPFGSNVAVQLPGKIEACAMHTHF